MTRSLRALAHKNYLLIWIGSLLSNIGNWVQNVAEGWVVADQTRSAFLVEMISFSQFLPVIFLVIPAGIIADKYNRKKVLFGAQLAMCLIAIILAITSHLNLLTPYFLISMAFFEGAAWAVGGPTWHTVIPNLVPRKDLESAISLNSIQYNIARLIGPAIAGVVIAKYGVAWAFDINAISFIAVILAILMVQLKPRNEMPTQTDDVVNFSQAWGWIDTHKGAKRILITITLFAVFSAPIQGLMPIFATNVFLVPPQGLGALFACLGAGAVIGAFLLGTLPLNYPRHHLIPLTMLMLGITVAIYSSVNNFYVACTLMVFIGIFWLATMVACNTAMQLLVPDKMRGRVMSVLLMGHVGMLPIGHLSAGLLAEYLNPQITLGLASVGLIIYALFTLWHREPGIDGITYTPHKIRLKNFFSDVVLATPYRIHHKRLAAEKLASTTSSSDLV
ncbi:MAG: MFS transporter [Oligoflexia bacterium]|nr:MFS transporter [Oligoflexia bacterium]